MCTWPKRWLKTGAETTWTPGESPRWVCTGQSVWWDTATGVLICARKLKNKVLSLTVAPAHLFFLVMFLCADVPFRSMRRWWRVWTGTPPLCRPRTPHRRPSRWRCGRNTSNGKRATRCVRKIRPSSPREVTYSRIQELWAAGFD